jgi:uncharacterized protein YutD
MILGPKKIRKRENKKKQKQKPARFRQIPARFVWIHGKFSPESLLRAFWEKKLKVPTLREIETLGGYIVNF